MINGFKAKGTGWLFHLMKFSEAILCLKHLFNRKRLAGEIL
jgi:hypothetical protein